jgi:hypothetical protein
MLPTRLELNAPMDREKEPRRPASLTLCCKYPP